MATLAAHEKHDLAWETNNSLSQEELWADPENGSLQLVFSKTCHICCRSSGIASHKSSPFHEISSGNPRRLTTALYHKNEQTYGSVTRDTLSYSRRWSFVNGVVPPSENVKNRMGHDNCHPATLLVRKSECVHHSTVNIGAVTEASTATLEDLARRISGCVVLWPVQDSKSSDLCAERELFIYICKVDILSEEPEYRHLSLHALPLGQKTHVQPCFSPSPRSPFRYWYTEWKLPIETYILCHYCELSLTRGKC